jgi:hypothetical protein
LVDWEQSVLSVRLAWQGADGRQPMIGAAIRCSISRSPCRMVVPALIGRRGPKRRRLPHADPSQSVHRLVMRRCTQRKGGRVHDAEPSASWY